MSSSQVNLTADSIQNAPPIFSDVGDKHSIYLQLTVSDSDSVAELAARREGIERDRYALGALRIGLLSLKHTQGQLEADAVRREGNRLLENLNGALDSYRAHLNETVTERLREYFDPQSGKLQERIERLIRRDGELEQALQHQIGSHDSELAKTLASSIGKDSELMRLLRPEEAGSLASTIRGSIQEIIQAERQQVLSQFSLDNKEGALSKLLSEVTEESGRFKGDLAEQIKNVVAEFSLDRPDSALSRLVRKVEDTQKSIADQFSLDADTSALSHMSNLLNETKREISHNLTLDSDDAALARLRRELLDILKRHEDRAAAFQSEVTTALGAMKARREEAARSTTHGREFESVTVDFIEHEATRAGDVAAATGSCTGAIKYCKVGDAVVELGPDSAAPGEKFVVEAKEDKSIDLGKARTEIDLARKNRGASVGVFVFSKKTAPVGQEPFFRLGNDIFVIWNSENTSDDVILKAALSLAKALCVRQTRQRKAEDANFKLMDDAILAVETEAARVSSMKTWTETIKANSGKLLEEMRKLSEGLELQVQNLRSALSGLQ
jgi:gas vesicle protein